MASNNFMYRGKIAKVRFNLAGSDQIKKGSHVAVKSNDLFRNNLPYPGGICDAHMGTIDQSYKCQTCYNSKRDCLGHPGHIHLNYPVWSQLAMNDAKKWIKLICFHCGKPILSDEQLFQFRRGKRLEEAAKVARSSNKTCHHCQTIHPIIKKDANEPSALIAEIYEEKRQISSRTILPHEAGEILSKISDETVEKMGKSIASHPRNAVIWDIQVPGVTIRPDVKKIGGGRSTNDDLTTMLQIISKKNDALPTVLPTVIDAKQAKLYFELNNAFADFVKAGGENSMASIASRWKGKTGRFRKNQLGKRTRNMCRSTIVGDPRIKINEVGVPLVFARTIQYNETVQEFNKRRLLQYVQNGSQKYPGATKIIDGITGAEHNIDSGRDIELKIGDIVQRDMIDGDPVNFNRQPSLMASNISTHRAKVILDPSIKTLLMNVLVCPLYNADFDGDAMNLIISSGVATRNEISELSSVANWFISHTTSSPALGQVDDSIIGTAELTRSNVKFDRYHAMLLCQNTTFLPRFEGNSFTGRECISKILAETPINFQRVPEWYKPNMAAFLNYDPSEIKVNISRGELTSGILDKKSIGKGANGGIYHIIANEYGAAKALDVMYNMQQMAISYIMQAGYTIGIMDLMIPEASKKEIDGIAADIINKSQLISDELQAGEIIPPIGKTIEQFFEERQINTLSIFDDFTEPVLKAINPQTNNLFKLIMFGSKGKLDNMFNIMSAIGQKLINGERIRQKFGFKRTLAYFPRFDMSPEARGYITNSYLAGMSSSEYIFNAMAARFDLISKALSTSITGEQNRKSIKNLESIIINNHKWAVKNKNVIQFAYGEDFLDPRKVERVKFPTVMISDEAFTTKYRREGFDDFFALMKKDRDEYRRLFMQVEHMNVKEMMSDERRMPVDVERTVTDILRGNPESSRVPTGEEIIQMTETIKIFCEAIPYVLINEIQEKRKSKIPEHIMKAAWLMTMLVKTHLHPNAFVTNRITPGLLKLIIDKIRLRYSQSLIEAGTAVGIIAAQSFSEPLTQYMLDAHHRSASGGTSKSTVIKTKEVLAARDVEKLISPSMLIPILPEFSGSKAKVQEIANNIEVMKFKQFVTSWQIFVEKYGEPVHTKYSHEKNIIEEFAKLNPLLSPPGDLIKWCVRFAINKTSLILKNMSLELIITRLREVFPETYIVYTPENAKNIIVRIYMRSSMYKNAISTQDVVKWKDLFIDTIIRGVNNINNTTVVKMLRNKINDDGSVSRDENQWGILTNGTNMSGIFANKYVDKYRVQTDSIQEVYQMLGIEAARQKVISELRGLVDVCNHRHYTIYADEMTFTGRVTSIESSGLKTREASNVLLRIGFSSPMATIEEATVNAMEDSVTGITAPLLIGSVPQIGSLYNSFHIDVDYVTKNVKRPDQVIEESLFA